MKQKRTWINYLIIGINLFLTYGCSEQIDYKVKADFIYVNSTDHIINFDDFQLNPNNSLKIEQVGEGDENITYLSYTTPTELSGIIRYDNKKCDTLYTGENAWRDNAEGILGIKNYKYKKISNRYYQFTYTFTDKDYSKAENCN